MRCSCLGYRGPFCSACSYAHWPVAMMASDGMALITYLDAIDPSEKTKDPSAPSPEPLGQTP